MRRTNSLYASAKSVVALSAALAAICLPAVSSASPDTGKRINLYQAVKRTLLLFPVDVSSTSVANVTNKEDLADLLTDVAASRINASGGFSLTRFSRAYPTIARLYGDQQLSDADLQPPFSDDNRKPIKIAKAAEFEQVFIGAIDDYQYDSGDNQVTLVVRGLLLDATNNKVLKSVVTNAASSKGGKAKEEEKAVEAARSAGEKMMTQLVPNIIAPPTNEGPKPPVDQGATPPKKKRSNDWLWGLLAVGLGLGIGLSSGGHGGGGSSNNGGGPPPPP